MPGLAQETTTHAAIVSRRESNPKAAGRYLQLTDSGSRWTDDAATATQFESMREAIRAAARLPAATCAFGIPRRAELLVQGQLH